MPTLDKLIIQDFRNIELQELCFSPNVNCISGGNGEGKTNLLEAVWYLSMTKSPQSMPDSFNFRHGTSRFSICGQYLMGDGILSRFSIQVSKDADGTEKKISRDGKQYGKVSEHIGILPIVLVSPSDVNMVSDSGEERRRFVNSVLSQMDPVYLSSVQQYNRFLAQRNKLLKSGTPDSDLLSVFDEKLSSCAEPIFRRREEFVRSLLPVVKEFYGKISGGREEIDITYRSCMHKGALKEVLEQHREQDKAMKFTTAGLQRDDFLFSMNGYPIRRCGSQGQQKSFLVALKFAQYDIMAGTYGFPPLLLLDDLFDKLDMSRVSNLLEMVAGKGFGQIFITDSNKTRVAGIVDSITDDRAYYIAEGGAFTNG